MGRVYDENGNVEQTNNYFAYGGLTNDVTAGTDTQTHKFGGKELDRMQNSLRLQRYNFFVKSTILKAKK